MLYYICKAMQTSESIVNTGISIGCNVILRYNIWYNKTRILMLLVALFYSCEIIKVNKYGTLSANENWQK